MSDRELLKLAAKAAGIIVGHAKRDPSVTFFRDDRGLVINWNPLTDDGDALRLAVKLEMQVVIGYRRIDACIVGEDDGGIYRGSETKEGDHYAATRRAITRAAAEIGKTMENQNV